VYPWGNTWDEKKANVNGTSDGYEMTALIGSFVAGASSNGALDMAGNVSEWVQDWYDGKYYQNGPPRNPRGLEGGRSKVQRGGSWQDEAWGVRVAHRGADEPRRWGYSVGFRCAQ